MTALPTSKVGEKRQNESQDFKYDIGNLNLSKITTA